jgi:inosine/xanthosine triphosphatase
MRLAVGSGNPVKRAATEDAVEVLPGAAVEAVPVDSGVSEQPVGRAETLAGAETRAANALAAGDYDLGVGIEGGVAEVDLADFETPLRVDEAGPDGLYLIMWAAVTDGSTVGRGGGPTIRLPERVADRVRNGGELGPVMDDVFDMTDVKVNEGAAGVLTDGIVDRQAALTTAVAGALGPFVTGAYE